MTAGRAKAAALVAALVGALACAVASPAAAEDAPAEGTAARAQPAKAQPAGAKAQPADTKAESAAEPDDVDAWDFEGAAFASVAFAELAVPEKGSLNPVGAGLYLTARYVPGSFPFHGYFESGGSLFASGTTTGPSGTEYRNRLSAWFFSPGAGFDLGSFRLTAGVGMALVMTRHFSDMGDNASLALAIAGNFGLAYRFFDHKPWATSVELRYQTVPGAKLDALMLGLRVRFASLR